jgi:hypothetical protein
MSSEFEFVAWKSTGDIFDGALSVLFMALLAIVSLPFSTMSTVLKRYDATFIQWTPVGK